MTDLELTKLCADAMELYVEFEESGGGEYGIWEAGWYVHDSGRMMFYDPLHDDSQAMALVKEYGLWITTIAPVGFDSRKLEWMVGHNKFANESIRKLDLNRAICECVADMMKAKNEAR